MNQVNVLSYVGKHQFLEIIDTTGFDTLTPNEVFIKQEASLVLPDGKVVPFANPIYLEFKNTTSGRKGLSESNINPKLIDAILLVWGDKVKEDEETD